MVAVVFIFRLLMVLVASCALATETDTARQQRMQWFQDAKLGIFVHWGIYAVDGIDESWSFYNGYVSYDDYLKQLDGFTAAKYDPQAWAALFARSGARYAVLTSKHHDGVALWNSEVSELDVVERTPAGRDLVGPFCKALRERDLKVGLYYSHLDWSHPDYPHWTREAKRYTDDPQRWARFLRFHRAQLEEIVTSYEPDLLWFDGDWDYGAERWQAGRLRERIDRWLPKVIVNSRLNGFGDYATPEQGLPITRPPEPWWELCLTMNDSWGYQPNDTNYKTANQVIRIFVDCLDMGGNLLLDVGPREDGTIPPEQVRILSELGRWIRKHDEAVYATRAGLPSGHFHGPTSLSADQKTLYLYVPHEPRGPLALKGIKNAVNRIRVVGNGTKLAWQIKMKQYWSSVPGIIYIDVPAQVLDEQVTVVAVLLDGPIELHREDADGAP